MSRKGRPKNLQHTVSILQNRFGTRAIRKMESSDAAPPPALSTGLRAVDGMLGIGGLPKGRITEVMGVGTAGQATLAAKAMDQAQQEGQQMLYVDVYHDVDLDFLHRCGVRFDALTILRPWSFAHGLEMAGDFIRGGGAGIIVWDRIPAAPPEPDAFDRLDTALREWNLWLGRSLSVLLFLTEVPSPQVYPSGLSLPFFASLRLLCERQEWLRRTQQVTGFTSRVSVLKNRFGPSGQSALIRVKFTNGIHAEDA